MKSNLLSHHRSYNKFARAPLFGLLLIALSSPSLHSLVQTNTGQLPASPGEPLSTISTQSERITNTNRITESKDDETPNAKLRQEELERSRNEKMMAEEPPNDFQNFVLLTTGQLLAVYGNELFRNIPATFAPLDRVPVPSDYVVGPGDELYLRGWGQVEIDYHA